MANSPDHLEPRERPLDEQSPLAGAVFTPDDVRLCEAVFLESLRLLHDGRRDLIPVPAHVVRRLVATAVLVTVHEEKRSSRDLASSVLRRVTGQVRNKGWTAMKRHSRTVVEDKEAGKVEKAVTCDDSKDQGLGGPGCEVDARSEAEAVHVGKVREAKKLVSPAPT